MPDENPKAAFDSDDIRILQKIYRQQRTHIRYRWVRLGVGLLLVIFFGWTAIPEFIAGKVTWDLLLVLLGFYSLSLSLEYWNGDPKLKFILDYLAKKQEYKPGDSGLPFF